jgi:hypothetical protein
LINHFSFILPAQGNKAGDEAAVHKSISRTAKVTQANATSSLYQGSQLLRTSTQPVNAQASSKVP